MHSTMVDCVEVVKPWQCEKLQPFAKSYVLKRLNSTQHFLLSFICTAKSHLKVHPTGGWSMFHHVSLWVCRPLHQAMPGCPAAEKSPLGGPSGTSLPAELSLVWHQPELLRALTLTHLQRPGPRLPAAGAEGGVQLPWVVEGLGGVAEVGAPQMKQGSQQHHWGGQEEVLGLKCREQKLDVKHDVLQPTDKVMFPLPAPRPDSRTRGWCKGAPSMQRGACINGQSATVVSSSDNLSLPVFSLLSSLAGLMFHSVPESEHRQCFPVRKWHILLLLPQLSVWR